jgi:hypothetical protein
MSLNHASLRTTERYLHGDTNLVKLALDGMPNVDGTDRSHTEEG